MSQQREARKFARACDQRLAAASCLLENGFHLDAVYLGGYAVECALKAVLMRRVARGESTLLKEQLMMVGAKGHDFEYLKYLLRKHRCAIASSTLESLSVVAGWSTDLRYETVALKYDDAMRFLKAVGTIRNWSQRN